MVPHFPLQIQDVRCFTLHFLTYLYCIVWVFSCTSNSRLTLNTHKFTVNPGRSVLKCLGELYIDMTLSQCKVLVGACGWGGACDGNTEPSICYPWHTPAPLDLVVELQCEIYTLTPFQHDMKDMEMSLTLRLLFLWSLNVFFCFFLLSVRKFIVAWLALWVCVCMCVWDYNLQLASPITDCLVSLD